MSTSTKTRASIRQGGPGAAHENAKARTEIKNPPRTIRKRRHSRVSGGGGEHDSHHSHPPKDKRGGSRPASKAKS